MANERKTERIVWKTLQKLGYFSDTTLTVEEQKSDSPRINKLLKSASKSGPGRGSPEFIISSDSHTNFILVVECKAESSCHESQTRNKYADYAVDGALLYASYLSKEYDVLAIGVSGESKAELRISHYLLLKGTSSLQGRFLGRTFCHFRTIMRGT